MGAARSAGARHRRSAGSHDVVLGAELLNKNGGEPFTASDEHVFREFAEPLGLILESCARLARRAAIAAAPTDLPPGAAC